MKKIKNLNVIILIILVFMIFQFIFFSNVIATNSKEEQIKKQVEEYAQNIDLNNIKKEDVLKAYDEITKNYDNEEISNLLEEHKSELKDQGVSEEIINYGKELLETTDKENIREIIDENIDFETLNKKLEQGYEAKEAVTQAIEETSLKDKMILAIKLIWSNTIIRTIIIIVSIIICVLFVYGTILRWIIYIKASKHGWAAIIPLYRQIVMYKICNLSPFLMLIWLIPVLGWLVMIAIAIMKRFMLAKSFGRGTSFGFGLLFLQPIFQSILAFNKNIKYEGDK